MKKIILAALRIYQKTISFDHGFFKYLKPFGQCKFYPSCSEYSYQSIKNRGIAQGTIAGLRRLIRCVPWSAGGIDLPFYAPDCPTMRVLSLRANQSLAASESVAGVSNLVSHCHCEEPQRRSNLVR